jgi:VanZ family protein
MRSQTLSIARIAGWSLALVIVALSVVPPSLRPETGVPHSLEHFTIYFVTGFAFALGYDLRRGVLATLLVIFAAAIEIAQLFVPGRHARLSDFVVDAFAVCVGLFSATVANRLRHYDIF